MSFEVNYQEDLVPRIRGLIDKYSVDSILKEYLQNADDAGSTELVVTFDKREHKYLNDTIFEVANENALLIYNNASFQDKDFESIVKLSAQGKSSDANATGRFGQGFSCSFSISDHPSFVSSGKAYWFDVLRNGVSKGRDKSIQGWSLENDGEEISPWLESFNIDNSEFGTTFRLPLRNEITANQSEISHEVFKYEDFLAWCVEWKNNASGLLFLRHIQKLVLQEISENNEKIIHLEISTQNSKEIQEYNDKIQNELSASLLEICNIWKNSKNSLPLFTYKHNFLIKYFDQDNSAYGDFKESWAVVNGLFRGEQDTLIDQAIKVLKIGPNPRKVLPWAGVAISLDEKGNARKNNRSNYHTFLPLPIKSKHPVHIHGWFDLDEKRTEITHDGSGVDKDILNEWNRLLFKEGVGIAWAHLIDFIKRSCDSRSYYSLWPKNHDDEFDQYLLEGFYKEITKLECFKIKFREETRWNKPTDNIYFFQNKADNKKLFDAFKEHFSMIAPKPLDNIVNSLMDAGVELQEVTPEFIRDYLNEASDELMLPSAMDSFPITMLSKKEWLLSVLVFCAEAEEDKNYSYLEGLPLQLTVDNNINIIESSALLDNNPDLLLFNNKSLFIHSDIIEIVKDAVELPQSWLEPNLNNYLIVLQEHMEDYDRKNKTWLKSLVRMIDNASESEIDDAIDALYGLEVVYQNDGEFSKLEDCEYSPVLITEEEKLNINFLEQTGIKLVHPSYINIYKPLLKLNKFKLIKELNSSSLIKCLVRILQDEYDFFKNKDTREYLIDLLAKDIAWIKELDDQESAWLDDMPFIATESGNVYAKSDTKKLYISVGFKPPKDIHNLKGEYEIIHIKDHNQYCLYKELGFDVQTAINYLKEIIIPFILGDNSVDDVRNILEWLANNWEEITKDIDENEKSNLILTLSTSKIVLNANNELGTANKYYLPSFFNKLPLSLQDKSFLPIVFEEKVTQDNWLDLLSKIGASTKIIPEHIQCIAKSIIRDENYGLAVNLLDYISNHFELFNEMKFFNKNIFDCLAQLAWIPTEHPGNDFLSPEHEYKKLCKPSEVILKNDHAIAGGSHYYLSKKVKLGKKDEDGEFTELVIAKKLGLLVNLPNESIFNSFRRLTSVYIEQELENKILFYARPFYKYLGKSNNILESDIPDDIKEKSLYIKGHWVESSRVFQTSIGLTNVFSWDEVISSDGKESDLARGLVKLGVLDKPDNDYLINYINELPKNQKLDKKQLDDAKVILKQFQNNLDELLDVDEIPLLSRSDQLIAKDEIYIIDLPAYTNSERKNKQLEFCQTQFVDLARHCGVVSLAHNIKAELDLENSKKSEEANSIWNEYIRLEPFKLAILRLIYHEDKINDEDLNQDSINFVLPSKVLSMDTLVVGYFIDDDWIYDDLNTAAYQDIENSTLYLLNQDDDEDMCESIANYICVESKLTNSESLINRILRNKFKTNEEIQKLLDKKNIKSLPDKIEIDEVGSLYVDDNEIEEYIDVAEDIVDDYTNEVQGSSPFGFAETEEFTHIDFDTKSESSSIAGTEIEIPPPITPKSSNFTNPKNEPHTFQNGSSFQGNVSKVDSKRAGSGSSTNFNTINKDKFGTRESKIVSPNDRKPVYVGKEREEDPDSQQEKNDYATEIGNTGENFVIENAAKYLLCESNLFVKTQTNNKGFDVSEVDANGEIVRYIEIKTLTGDWGEGGVGLTAAQLKFAQDNENWWLFVVENINTINTKVHTFKNPVHQANRFMFDHSWIQLAETAKNSMLSIPNLGDKYLILDGTYVIVSIETKGKFYKVRIKDIKTGEELIKNFDPKWVKC